MLVDSEDRGESVGAIHWVDLESRCSGSAKEFHAEIARWGEEKITQELIAQLRPKPSPSASAALSARRAGASAMQCFRSLNRR
jgi:hypothetical protein